MKRKLLTALAIVLAFLMMGSAFATIITLIVSAEDKTFNTTEPVFIYDFSNDSLLSTFANTANMNVETQDGYTTFTATANDPYTWLFCPPVKPCEMKYVKILYRTTGNYNPAYRISAEPLSLKIEIYIFALGRRKIIGAYEHLCKTESAIWTIYATLHAAATVAERDSSV
jgi:hypothetical protein